MYSLHDTKTTCLGRPDVCRRNTLIDLCRLHLKVAAVFLVCSAATLCDVTAYVVKPPIQDCQKLTSCSCQSSTLGVVDLSPLAKSDGSPRFLNVPSGVEYYSWNPCTSFTVGECQNVAACQKITFTSSSYYNLGTQDSAKFMVSEDGLVLSYSANSLSGNFNHTPTDFLRTTYVKLECDVTKDPGTFVVIGEDPARYGNYHFTLTSIHACPEKLKPLPDVATLSVGTCLLIVFLLSLSLYFGIGIAVQIFVCKKSGKEVVPNGAFWGSLPGLIKDGVILVFRRGKTPTYVEFK